MSKFIVKVWETEYDRDKGECDSSYFDTLDEALTEAKCYGTRPACVEVVDDEYSTFYHMSEDGIFEDVDGNIEF